jgi:ribosylpyrimidine nucleosidase
LSECRPKSEKKGENFLKVIIVLSALTIGALNLAALVQAQATAVGPRRVIIDTDFNIGRGGDDPSLQLALNSPEVRILGLTLVAGNLAVPQETVEALSELQYAGHSEIPVYMGANRPLVHEISDWAKTTRDKWWTDRPVVEPPAGFAKAQAQKESAVDFLVRTVNANPGQITIIVIGPCTNIATAIRQSPDFAKNVKQLSIMGGAIASLPGGSGNFTPNAEFNIWNDPEAAQVVFRSGIPITLVPLNPGRVHTTDPNTRSFHMTDELATAFVIDPTLVKTVDMYVDVDINHGLDYGTTIGSQKIWEGEEGVIKQLSVVYDVDYDRLMKFYADRIGSYDDRFQKLTWSRTKK